MKKVFNALTLGLVFMFTFITLTACSYSFNDMQYWFSNASTKFVKYDETLNGGYGNLEEAGTYWEMTIKNDCILTIKIINDSLSMFSTTYCYVNDEQVQSESDTDIYSFVYKDMELKKGDTIKLHAFWTNSLTTNENGFEMSMFVVNDYIVDFVSF